MTLDHGYCVVAGTFASFTRDDPDHFGRWYHGKLKITTPAGEYEAALDVDTPSGAGISYRLVDDLRARDISLVEALPDGLTRLAPNPTSGALDYVRSPILQDGWVIRLLRRRSAQRRSAQRRSRGSSAPWAPIMTDRWLARLRPWRWWIVRWLPWRSFPWVPSNGDNALDLLEMLLPAANRVMIFGEPFTSGLGVHNVHLNQGDPPGQHQAEDGIWQDGAVVIRDNGGVVRVWMIKFNSQSLDTGPDGKPR